MEETTFEKAIGDIIYRNRLISDLVHNETTESAYGPLTLQRVDDGILPTDFDGRVYETIPVPDDPDKDDVLDARVQADKTVEQLHDEL